MQMTKLKQMRLLMKMTQSELAKKVGVKSPTVNTLERVGIWNTKTAKKYAAAFDCNLLFLLEGLE